MEYFLLCVALAVIMIVFFAVPVATFKSIAQWLQSASKKKPPLKDREEAHEIMKRVSAKMRKKAEDDGQYRRN